MFDAFIKEANTLLAVSNSIRASELYCWRHHDETLSQNDETENEWQRADKATIRFALSSFKCVCLRVLSSSGVITRVTRTRKIPISSACQVPSCLIRPLSSSSTLPIKITMDEIVFRRSKTQRLLDLDTLASNDWSATKQMLFWWTRQGTREGVDWAWKILDRLVVDLSNNMNENGAETQIRAKILTDWLNFTVNSWRLLTIHTQSETTTTTTSLP